MSIKGINITYKVNNNTILDNVSLEIKENEIISVVGPNGAGKSTFINILAGDYEPHNGHVEYDGNTLKNISLQERAFCRSVMSQSQPLIFDYSVKEVIEMGWIDRGSLVYVDNLKQIILKIAEECFISNLLSNKFRTLSGGEQRRVHFARTLIQLWRPSGSEDPRYMFLDEPTSNLDLFYELKILDLVKNKSKEGFGCLIILHDLNLAAKYSDRIALFHQGRIIKVGVPEEIMSNKILKEVYKLSFNISKNPFRIQYY